jgi:transglutaminase-like putative cysteine protease
MVESRTRTVTARLLMEVDEPADVIVQVAVANAHPEISETLTVEAVGGRQVPEVVAMPDAGRAHRFTAPPGAVAISYEATVLGGAEVPRVSRGDAVTYLRPSRYAESDRLAATAAAEFGGIEDRHELLTAVASWVGTRLAYIPGVSRPTDGAVQTLLAREGVCRDYAHLAIALLRALDVPARLVAVYAPGLSPMDFHAVAEAAIDGVWYVVDPTALAPRSTLLRISTGRDAADTAFMSTYGGRVELLESTVSAVVSGDLPDDDVNQAVSIA